MNYPEEVDVRQMRSNPWQPMFLEISPSEANVFGTKIIEVILMMILLSGPIDFRYSQ